MNLCMNDGSDSWKEVTGVMMMMMMMIQSKSEHDRRLRHRSCPGVFHEDSSACQVFLS